MGEALRLYKCLQVATLTILFAISAPTLAVETAEDDGSSAEEDIDTQSSGDGGVSEAGAAANAWRLRMSKLGTLEGRIKDSRKKVQNLIKLKNMTEDREKLAPILADLLAAHKELQEQVQEYQDIKDELRYRFPNKGELVERKYFPFRKLSVEQIEEEMTLSGRLTQFKRKVDLKYRAFTRRKSKKIKVIRRSTASKKGPQPLVLEK